jgi:CubicO group peptidase (beta-lactamase class C family)
VKRVFQSLMHGVLALASLAWGSSWADDLPRARPAELGFSAERLSFIDGYYADKVKKGEMAGLVLLIARHGKIAHFSAIGYADTGSQRKLQRLVKIPLHYQPGTKFEYSLVQDVQARLVEILSGMPFDQFLEQRLFIPLGHERHQSLGQTGESLELILRTISSSWR